MEYWTEDEGCGGGGLVWKRMGAWEEVLVVDGCQDFDRKR